MSGDEWMRLMLAVGLLGALFAFPAISLALDERRKRRRGEEPPD